MEDYIKIEENDNLDESRKKINRNFKILKDNLSEISVTAPYNYHKAETTLLKVGNFYNLGTILAFPDIVSTKCIDNQPIKQIKAFFNCEETISLTTYTITYEDITWYGTNFEISNNSIDAGTYTVEIIDNNAFITKLL